MIATKAAYYHAAGNIRLLLPRGLCFPDTPFFLNQEFWDLLVLSREGCRMILSHRVSCICRTLLLPGTETGAVTQLVQAQQVVSAGCAQQNSITFSSFQPGSPLICVQRTLLRRDGSEIEPQEFLLTDTPLPPEEQLLLFGTQLLLC